MVSVIARRSNMANMGTRHFPVSFLPIPILLFIMAGFDIITNSDKISFVSAWYYPWLCVAEESLKIFSEGMFIGGFYLCFLIASNRLITRPVATRYITLKDEDRGSNGIENDS